MNYANTPVFLQRKSGKMSFYDSSKVLYNAYHFCLHERPIRALHPQPLILITPSAFDFAKLFYFKWVQL